MESHPALIIDTDTAFDLLAQVIRQWRLDARRNPTAAADLAAFLEVPEAEAIASPKRRPPGRPPGRPAFW